MTVITKVLLILQISLAANPALNLSPPRHQSLSPRPDEGARPQPLLDKLPENNPAYWAGFLGGHPNFPAPPPEPPARINSYSHPPPGIPVVDLHQNLLTFFSNPPNFQQILNQLNQPPPLSPCQTLYSPLGATQDPSWALAPSVAQPMSHLCRLTSSGPVNFAEVEHPNMFPPWAPTFLSPPQQHVFSPFSFPGTMWSQPRPIMSPQPTHMMTTPVSQKRRLPPSPEFSPKGNYIGQHSQGLGGHYADSYFKKKKSN